MRSMTTAAQQQNITSIPTIDTLPLLPQESIPTITDWIDDDPTANISGQTPLPIATTHSLPIHASDDDTFPEFTDSDDFDDLFSPTNDDHNINNFSTSIIDNHDTTPPPTQSTTKQCGCVTFHSPSTHQLDISTFVTQNTHGLRRLP